MKTSIKFLAAILVTTPVFAFANADLLVNPNRADAREIQDDLIGVTEQQAKEVVEYRQDHGDFNSKEDLLKVEGIGRDFLNINQDYLYLDEEQDREFTG